MEAAAEAGKEEGAVASPVQHSDVRINLSGNEMDVLDKLRFNKSALTLPRRVENKRTFKRPFIISSLVTWQLLIFQTTIRRRPRASPRAGSCFRIIFSPSSRLFFSISFFLSFFFFLSLSLSFFFFGGGGGGFNYHKSYLSKSSSSYFSELNEKLGWLEARINKRASAAGYWNKFWWHIDLKWFEPWRRPMLETTDSINYINSVPLHLVPIHSAIVWQKFVGFHIRNFPLLYTPTADSNRPADLIVQSKVILLYMGIRFFVSVSLSLSIYLSLFRLLSFF